MEKKSKIVVIGSSNTDMVVKTSRMPAPGETVLGGEFFMNQGGKGANQAVAVSRLGGDLLFVAKVGDDVFGRQAIEAYKQEGMDTSAVLVDKHRATGVAMITIDAGGENSIVVAPGANDALSVSDIENVRDRIEHAEYLLMQFETPIETITHAAKLAKVKGLKVVLNPAPACIISSELIECVSILTPNETEAGIVTGINVTDLDSAKAAARQINEMGVESVIITLGSKGSLVYDQGEFSVVEAHKVKAVDTTAAGDTYNGALVTTLSEGKPLLEAVRFATAAAAISVTRLGAQASVPYRDEVE